MKMNPTEPDKVIVQIQDDIPASIGGFIWDDLNKNGIYDVGEPRVNGVRVELYDSSRNLIASTVTADDIKENSGFYKFDNLEAGKYYVKFVPSGEDTLTIQKPSEGSEFNPNPTTGFTDLITLEKNEAITTANAGIVKKCIPPIIYASNKCIFVGDTFNPLTGVTAKDCYGSNITSSIIVTFNNVNTSVPGIYSVTYSVTDRNGLTTTKTILVKVCEKGPHYQAITDLYESVALEKTALAHILSVERQKIARAKVLGLSNEEIMKINDSIKNMSDVIAKLEIVLQGKIEIFDCDACGDGCCDDFR